jgi:hypothetical protein
LGDLIGIICFREDLQATLVIGMTDLGQADAARAPVEKANPEPLLERLNVRGHHAGRHAQRPRRRGKAAALHHLYEGGHAGHAVHAIT